MTRTLLATAVALSLAATTSAFAAEQRSADVQGSASPSAPTAGGPADRSAPAADASRLVENAKRLQEEAGDIASANTESERQRLLQRHVQTLRAAMMLSAQMLHDTSGQPWMRGGPGGSAGIGEGMGPGIGGRMGPGMGGGMGPGMSGRMGPGMGYGMDHGMRHGMGHGMGHGMMGMGPGMGGGPAGPGMRGGGMGPGMMTMMMVMMDTNGDGALSLEEVQAVHARMFKYADADDDGKLTRNELKGFFRHGPLDSEED